MTEAVIAEWQAGLISAEVALARLVLAGQDPAATPLAAEALRHRDGLARIARMVAAAEIEHGPRDEAPLASVARVRALFDRAAAVSPEGAVAAYSLADPLLLQEATDEVAAWLAARGLLRPDARVLDLGSGIGRIAGAVAGRVGSVLGLDVSPAMTRLAAERVEAANVRFETTDGLDLRGIADASIDLVLAIDSFPYVVQAGLGAAMTAEVARVLRPGGVFVAVNVAYGDHPAAGIDDWADASGLVLTTAGEQPFTTWDGRVFVLEKPDPDPWMEAMRDGDFTAAHAIADAVLAGHDRSTRDDPAQPYHLRWVWDGTAPDGRDVLVRCYHGLGDTLQFARFLPALAARAASVTVEAPAALVPLLAGLGRVVPFDPQAPLPVARGVVAVEIMELAHLLQADDLTLPAADYLYRRGVVGRGIGVCWRAGDWDAARSVPREALWAACEHPGTRLISLQHGEGIDDDAERTAALVRSVGLVVTVDTMIAHLAGALGKPAFVLLRRDADWRWQRGDRSLWYPDARLFRQAREGDWSRPLASVSDALRRRAED